MPSICSAGTDPYFEISCSLENELFESVAMSSHTLLMSSFSVPA